jgi:hypothetical protein
LANLALAIYRGEADHRHALFMQGQDTLVVIGAPEEDKTYRVGANATITVPIGGDAKFIGVSSQGLSEMRHNLENDKKIAAIRGAQLIDTTSRQRESGEALEIRVAAQTATLTQIAKAGAEGLKRILRIAAEWLGDNPSEVDVIPNTDFTAAEMSGKELVDLMTAKMLGAPLGKEEVHAIMRRRGLTNLTFEESMSKIEEEGPTGPTDQNV